MTPPDVKLLFYILVYADNEAMVAYWWVPLISFFLSLIFFYVFFNFVAALGLVSKNDILSLCFSLDRVRFARCGHRYTVKCIFIILLWEQPIFGEETQSWCLKPFHAQFCFIRNIKALSRPFRLTSTTTKKARSNEC